MSSVLKATTENKTTSVKTHFKKLTTGNNVLIVSVIVQSNYYILFLHQMFNMSALLLNDALLKSFWHRIAYFVLMVPLRIYSLTYHALFIRSSLQLYYSIRPIHFFTPHAA